MIVIHKSVLLCEVIENLNIRPTGIYIDGTLGRAGHATEILKKLTTGQLIGFDQDVQAINESSDILSKVNGNYTLFNKNFTEIGNVLLTHNISEVDGIFLDLGVSSPQFDQIDRGFSYQLDSRLDMRMNQQQFLDAYQVVNHYQYAAIVKILREYGEERYAVAIAKNIIRSRPINTTLELVSVIKQSLPMKVLSKKGHPAKQTFQALRIEVNQELAALEKVLDTGLQLLAKNGRMAVITFHSLEDRIVKHKFKELSEIKIPKDLIIKAKDYPQSDYQIILKKPIIASQYEIEMNPRAKSAKLRVIERMFKK